MKLSQIWLIKIYQTHMFRVEVICDRQGFWLKPHCDIKEKLMSGLIFVNNANESEELGTDFL